MEMKEKMKEKMQARIGKRAHILYTFHFKIDIMEDRVYAKFHNINKSHSNPDSKTTGIDIGSTPIRCRQHRI